MLGVEANTAVICRHKNSSHVAFYIRICFSRKMLALETLLTLYLSVSLLPRDAELPPGQPLRMVSRPSYLSSSWKIPAIIIPKSSYCTLHFWLYWSFFSSILNLGSLGIYWIPDCCQSENRIRANNSITFSPLYSFQLQGLSCIAEECFIVAKIPRYLFHHHTNYLPGNYYVKEYCHVSYGIYAPQWPLLCALMVHLWT